MSFYEEGIKPSEGLSSREALNILIEECEEAVSRWTNSPESHKTFLRSLHSSPHPCFFHISILFISSLLIAIGAVDLENEISISLLVAAFFLFIYSLFILVYIWRRCRKSQQIQVEKVRSMTRYLRNTRDNFAYSAFPEPLTEDMWGQLCVRNGRTVNVPKILVVRGDLVLLRPGQIVPCGCLTEEGTHLTTGEKVKMNIEMDKETGGYVQLRPFRATCMESPLASILNQHLWRKESPAKLEQVIQKIVHVWAEKYILIPYILLASVAVAVRYLSASSVSYYGTRYVFSIPALIVLPLVVPTLPIIMEAARFWNNKSVYSSLGIAYESADKDFLDVFSRLTGVSVVDKKGILSSANPCIDKIIISKYNEESYLVPDTMGLSSEMVEDGSWKLYFDDPSWKEDLPSLRPLGLNLQLNSCLHNEEYIAFLDHLTVVSSQVPRTIVTASRRCMCQLPHLLGFNSSSCFQFMQSEPKTLCFYKRQPGEAPHHGLTKHRTPMEMAFCTIHSDTSSNHGHISCQGTADVILDACTHIWNGNSVVPLSSRLSRQIREIYQRNSMTGYCLLLSYRPTNVAVSESLSRQYIEVPLAREDIHDESIMVRSLSTENIPKSVDNKTLETAEEVIENILSGQILCGVVALQYEALPNAVQLVESLENNCIRFVYFSRENELRSRVFAEKLGLEAGWNCHISLAEATNEKESTKPLQEVFKSTMVNFGENWEKVGLLKKDFLSKSESYLIEEPENKNRKSPARKPSNSSTVKVGAMPNKAQLPTGVSRVRPHLEEVDNVPLLVGLFTDCDPEVNRQMLGIMQENEEVVLTVGSSLNTSNAPMFIQSDLSACVPPLSDANCSFFSRQSGALMANDIAARLMAITTDFELSHKQLLNISSTVTGCRNRIASIRSALIFTVMASAQYSILLFSSVLLVLPFIFTTSQIFLTTFVQIPLLFLATVWTPFKPKRNFIRIAPKDHEKASLIHHLITFSIQFLPSIIVLLATFFISLAENATLLCAYSDVVCSFGDELRLSTEEIRHIIGLHFILYLVTNSICFVYPLSLFCYQLSFATPPWIVASLTCISLQVGYSYLSGVYLHRIVSYPSIALVISWIIIMGIINEICKMKNIRTFLREQRRTKLAFDTKLGMNSPY